MHLYDTEDNLGHITTVHMLNGVIVIIGTLKWSLDNVWINIIHIQHIHGLVQERRNSIAHALGLCLSCTNTSI